MHTVLAYLLKYITLCIITRCFYVLARIWLHRLNILKLVVSRVSTTQYSTVNTLVVLGSGGHTSEMIAVLKGLNLQDIYTPITYISALNDTTSIDRVKHSLYIDKFNTNQFHFSTKNVHFHTISRSRNVGQSYITSIFTTLRAMYESLSIVYHTHPELLLINGPGTAIPLCCSALLYHIFLFRSVQIVYIESYCRVTTLSLSGLLLYPVASRFIVQWKQLRNILINNTSTLTECIL